MQNQYKNLGLELCFKQNASNRHRIFYSNAMEYTSLLNHTWTILEDKSHVKPQKSLNKFEKTQIILGITSNHGGIKLGTTNRSN